MSSLALYRSPSFSSLFDTLLSPWGHGSKSLSYDLFDSDYSTDRDTSRDYSTSISPNVDVVENEDSYQILAEMPGLDKKDLSVDVSDGILTIKGERKEEKEKVEKGKGNKGKYHYLERSYGSYVRQFRLSEDVDQDSVSAKYNNGVLELNIKKSEKAKPKQIEIKVE